MAIEVGSAFVSIIPSARGFGRNLSGQINGDVDRSGRDAGARFGSSFGPAAAVGVGGVAAAFGPIGLAAAGAAAALVPAINKAGEFDKTIRTVGATTGLTGPQLQGLTDLAIEFGSKTTFSAQGAADAMLELAKGGLTAAQIEAGALRDTLTLAAAGGLELGEAASFMVQGLTTFGLTADQGGQVAAALAGAANASTASVQSIGQALSQVGPSAKLAGLTIQETTAAIAAFDNAGVRGSDAGTSLKTMLSRLVPSTEAASTEMANLGLNFRDAQGNFIPLRDIAEQLQTGLTGLSESQKTTALTTIFGSDAFRAAAILAENGAEGIDKLVGATSNVNAATEMAKVGTEGYAGALEAFKGAVETAQIQLGLGLLPVATDVLNFLTGAIGTLSQVSGAFRATFGQPIVAAITAIRDVLGAVIAYMQTGDVLGLAAALGVETWSPIVQAIEAVRGAAQYLAATFQSLFTAFQTGFQSSGLEGGFSALANTIGLILPTLVVKFAEVFSGLGAVIGPLVVPLLVSMGQAIIASLPTILSVLGQVGAAIVGGLGSAIAAAAPAAIGFLAGLGQALVVAAPALIGTVAGLLVQVGQAIVTNLPTILTTLGQIGSAIIAGLGQALIAAAPGLGSTFGPIVGALGRFLAVLGPVFGTVAAAIAPLVTAFLGLVQTVGGFVLSIAPQVIAFATQFLAIAGPAFSTIATLISTQLVPAIQRFLPAIQPIVSFLLGVFGSAILGAFNGIVTAVQGAITLISGVINVFTALLTGNWSAAWNGIKQIVTGALQAILGFVQVWLNVSIIGFFRGGFLSLAGLFTGGVGAIRNAFVGGFRLMDDAIRATMTNLFTFLTSIPGRIVSLFTNLGSTLYGAGKDLVQGLLNGAGSLLPRLGSFMLEKLPAFIKEPFRQAMGIESPSRVMAEMGSDVTAGLVQGIIGGQRDVTRSVDGLVPGQVRAPRLVGAGATGAGGFGQNSTTSWLSGASITVQAQDPAALQRQLEARARLESLVGAA